jgi:hypothetical protein
MTQQSLILAPIYPCDYDGKMEWTFVDQHGINSTQLREAFLLAHYDSPSQCNAARGLIQSILSVYGVSGQSSSRPALNQKQTLATLELLHGSQLVTDGAYSEAVEAVVNAGTYRNADNMIPSLAPLDYESEADGDWSHVNLESGSVSTLECLALDGRFGMGVLVPVEKQRHRLVPSPESPPVVSSKEDSERVFVHITFGCPGYGTEDLV